MRILHVVPYCEIPGADQSDDQGRTDVVLSQCAELRRRGHDVQVLGGWQPANGAATPPQVMDGVPMHLFGADAGRVSGRVTGLALDRLVLTARIRAWLLRNGPTFDLVHLHLTRDRHLLAASAPVRRAGVPYVVQLHEPLGEADGLVDRVRDRLRILPTLERACLLLAVDAAERTAITDLLRRNDRPLAERHEVIELLGEGVRLRPVSEDQPSGDPAGQPHGRPLDVVSTGRLGVDVQPMTFARAALALVERGVDATFTVLGPDGGALAALQEFVSEHPELDGRLRYDGAPGYNAIRERLAGADLFVLPAVPGSRSPAMLEALAAGVPSICTTDDRHAIALRSRRAARVVRPNASALAAAVADLAEDHTERADLGRRGRTVAGLLFDVAGVVDRLEDHYADALLRAYPLPQGEGQDLESPGVKASGRVSTGATVIDLAVPRQSARPATEAPAQAPTEAPDEAPAEAPGEAPVRAHVDGTDEAPDAAAALGTDRLLWVAVEATAHRVALWRAVARMTDLTVVLLEPEARGPGLRLAAAAEPFHLVHLRAERRTVVHGIPRYAAPRSLRTLVRRRPDAVVLDGWESPAFHAAARWARRAGVPVVASYGTAEPRTAPAATDRPRAGSPPRAGSRGSRSIGRLLRRADAVLAGGDESARAAVDLGVAADRITVTPRITGLPAGEHTGGVVDVREGHRFLFVGPLIGRTNVIGLVHAFRLARGIGDVLTVAGTGPLSVELVETAEQLGLAEHVVLVPAGGRGRRYRDRLLADAHTVVIPSTDEVWGHDVEEALAAGRNVVVSTACAVSDAVAARPDVFVAQPSPAALARAMMSSRRHWALVRFGRAAATISLDDVETAQVVSAGSRPGWD